ncbi:hypothetical protein KI387_006897 [Taxus chinensis]|uniref:Peroxisomal membrane protein PEX14 n=1 Tax=Taxus chinensis TaxID=29808 RepID=A0AA38LJY5_TAXCH|nr:hypothetical protein KI387_006897 [Taxus chinensis]
MATESSSPNQVDDKVLSATKISVVLSPYNMFHANYLCSSLAGESVKTVEAGGAAEAKGDITKEKDGNWPFANSEPMREDQVQNAVKFLSHPKVSGSPVIYRRSFLERKGLTKEEIDEAFRRVPDPPSQEAAARSTVPTQEKQSVPLATLQTQSPVQTLQHSADPPVRASAAAMVQPSHFQWTHMLLALGILSATGAGTGVVFKKAIIPRFKSWIRQIVCEANDYEQKKPVGPSPVEEAVAAAKAAATAAAEVANASREMLKSKHEDSKHLEGLMRSLEEQTKEMKSMKIVLKEMENHRGKNHSAWGAVSSINQLEHGVPQTISKNLRADANVSTVDQGLVRPSSAPASGEPSQAPYSNSYIELMSMVQRGEKPPGIKEVNDKPPNPNQPPSNPQLQPRPKPWDTIQAQSSNSKHNTHAQYIQTVNSSVARDGLKPVVNGFSNIQPKSTSPVTVRTSDNEEPWWRAKKNETERRVGATTVHGSNVRIAETESSDEEINGGVTHDLPSHSLLQTAADGPGNNSLRHSSGRTWVPPPTPPVAMPQAAEAIWHPKSKVEIQDPNMTSEMSDSSRSVLRPESIDDQFMPPRIVTEQGEEKLSSSSEAQNITENNKEEINHLSAFTEEASYDTRSYKDVVNGGIEEKEDVRAY